MEARGGYGGWWLAFWGDNKGFSRIILITTSGIILILI